MEFGILFCLNFDPYIPIFLSTKCINYYPLITNIGYNEGIYRSQALRYESSTVIVNLIYAISY